MSRRNNRRKKFYPKPGSARSSVNGSQYKSAEMQAYEASSQGRRLGEWEAPSLGPTAAVTTELDMLRRRMQASVRNNPWISRALKADVASEVGTGIIPRPTSDDDDFNKNALELYNDYHPHADITGFLGVYGIQAQAVRARKESGESFILIHRQRSNRNIPVPVQFQVIESNMCPTWYNRVATAGVNKIVSGVEVNGYGRPVAYWMYKNNPDDWYHVNSTELVRIKVEDVIHHFIPNRPGQLRGEPQGVQSAVRSFIYDKYDDAELGRKQARANFTGVIRKPDYGESDYKFDPISGDSLKEDDEGHAMIELESGTFPSLLAGEDITLFDGDDSGRGYRDFQWHQLLGISAGWDIPYQLMTGDYTLINDRIWRAIMNQYHREVEQVQELYVIAQICRRMWNEFIDRAILSGMLKAPKDNGSKFNRLRCKHRPQAWKHIHPVQDVQAKIIAKDAGLTSRQKEVDGLGSESVEEIDRQRAEDNEREKKLGLNEVEETKENDNDKSTDKNKQTVQKKPDK